VHDASEDAGGHYDVEVINMKNDIWIQDVEKGLVDAFQEGCREDGRDKTRYWEISEKFLLPEDDFEISLSSIQL